MFSYFKRIQLFVIILLSAALIGSLALARAPQSSETADPEEKETQFYLASNKTVSKAEFRRLVAFLDKERGTLDGERFNPLNLGWFTRLFLENEQWKKVPSLHAAFELNAQASREADRLWHPYSHRILSHVTQRGLWEYVAPELDEMWQEYSTALRRDPEAVLSNKVKLYLAQNNLSTYMQERMLRYTENQSLQEYRVSAFKDGGLDAERLAILGNKSVSDWFGEKVLQQCAELVFRGAYEAEKLGYSCSNAQAQRIWRHDFESLLASHADTSVDSALLLTKLLQRAGISQEQLTAIYKQVILYRSLMQHNTQFILHDDSVDNSYGKWSTQTVKGMHFVADEAYHFQNARELFQWLAYSSKLCEHESFGGVSYPVAWKSQDDFGSFAAHPYTLKVKSLSNNQVLSAYPVEQWLNWQIEDGLWQKACEVIDPLEGQKALASDSRKAALVALSGPQRHKLEQLSVRYIVESNPEFLKSLFEEESPKDSQVVLSEYASTTPFAGLVDSKALIEHLNYLSDSSEVELNSIYHQNDELYYQFEVEQQDSVRRLSFAEAQSMGVADLLLEKEVGFSYSQTPKNSDYGSGQAAEQEEKMRNENAFLQKAMQSYDTTNLLQALTKLSLDHGFDGAFIEETAHKSRLDFLAKNYWIPYFESVRSAVPGSNQQLLKSDLPWAPQAQPLEVNREESKQYSFAAFATDAGKFARSFSLDSDNNNRGTYVLSSSGKPVLSDVFSGYSGLFLVEEILEGDSAGTVLSRSGEQFFAQEVTAGILENILSEHLSSNSDHADAVIATEDSQ